MSLRVHQFVPTFEMGAIGGHALQIQRLCRDNGWESEIYAQFIRDDVRDKAHFLSEHDANVPQIMIYQMAVGSAVADYVRQYRHPLILNNHNLTPAEFLEPWDPSVSYAIQWGYRQLRELAPITSLVVSDSAFNDSELADFGYRDTTVVPILLDTSEFDRNVDQEALKTLQENKKGSTWIFVGRVAPNKCQHDLVKAFAFYREVFDREAHLYIVGGSSSETYSAAIDSFIETADLKDPVTVTGSVSDGELGAYYQIADVFTCASEHEGFCVPLLEAMYHETPIVAYSSSAIPETLGGGGLLLKDKSPAVFASAVNRVMTDDALRKQMVASGSERLKDFSLDKTRALFAAAIEKVANQ